MSVLREGLLAGRVVAVDQIPHPIRDRLIVLGAEIQRLEDGVDEHVGALVYDAAPAFGGGGEEGLKAALERTWEAVQEVAAGRLIGSGRGGKVLILAPAQDAGDFARAAAAALENLARTLSVEWARYAVTATLISRGRRADDEQLAELLCFLLSPAGDYFSGCRFDLGAGPQLIRRS